jgi:uncharacterized protein
MVPPAGSRPPAGSPVPVTSYWKELVPALWLWIVLIALIGGMGLYIRFTESTSPWIDLGASLAMLVVVGFACWPARRQLKTLLTGFGLSGVRLLEPVAALACLFAFMWAYFGLLELLHVEMIPITDDISESGWPMWTTCLSVGLLPAFTEELAFRGFIQSKLERIGKRNEALVIQAAMFSLLHLLPTIFLSHFVFGLVLGILRNRSRSLYPGMLVHFVWNMFIVWQEIQGVTIL